MGVFAQNSTWLPIDIHGAQGVRRVLSVVRSVER